MKKRLLVVATVLLLSGCFHFFYRFHEHEVTITLKDGVPCFGLSDDERLRSEQVQIYSIGVQHEVSGQLPASVMSKMLDYITLRSGECIPYEGEAIKTNLLYAISFGVSLKNRRHNEEHGYGGSFCLSENKNGEKVLHYFKVRERSTDRSTSCPVSSDE